MNLFSELDYRLALKELIQLRKQEDPKISYSSIAASAKISQPYLSKVIQGKCELSQDQLFLIAEKLQLKDSEINYLLLILEYSKCQIPSRRKKMQAQIEKIRDQYLSVQTALEKGGVSVDELQLKYYLDPYQSLVHLALDIDQYKKDIKLLARDLGLSIAKLKKTLSRLEQMGLIKTNPIKVLLRDVHLSKSSEAFPLYRREMRRLSIQQLDALPTESSYSYTTLFTADDATRLKIQALFIEFQKKAFQFIQPAPSENLYQLNFDLLPWTKK